MEVLRHTRTRRKLIIMDSNLVTSSPDILGGTPVFTGTRVPIQTLVDYLKAGESIDDFLDGFPSVSREQVLAFIDVAKENLVRSLA
jgi:uncharacterized protein (DUF433 family)